MIWVMGVWFTSSIVQSLSHVQLFATPWTAACQDSLSFTISRSFLKLRSIESVMPSNHLIPSSPPLLLPSVGSWKTHWKHPLSREHLTSTPQAEMKAKWPYLFVTEASHLVHKLLLDHEGSQVGCVAGQEDDGEEGPHGHHDLAGGPFRILDRHGVVEHQAPEEPNSFSNCKRRPMGCCKWQEGHSQRILKTHTWEHALAPATLKAVRRQVYLITVLGPQPRVLFFSKN